MESRDRGHLGPPSGAGAANPQTAVAPSGWAARGAAGGAHPAPVLREGGADPWPRPSPARPRRPGLRGAARAGPARQVPASLTAALPRRLPAGELAALAQALEK